MSNLSQRDPPKLDTAPTGRSKCQRCREPIAQGDQRVGMVGRSSGISCMKWMKPNCFATNMRVDYAPTGRAKCTLDPDGDFIAKGEPRFLLRMLNDCTQTVKSQQIYRPTNAAEIVSKFLALDGVTVTVSSIDGLEALESEEHRQWVVDALSGKDVSAKPVPIAAAATAAKPRAPKKKKQEKEEEEEEAGEVAPPAKRAKAKAPKAKPKAKPEVMADADGESSTEEVD